jgi:hypothetical protein
MMRRLITTLLILVLTLSGTTRALASPRDEDVRLAPEEEQQARELTINFMRRLREADDFAPLVPEFFPADFASRAREFVRAQQLESGFFVICDRDVLLQASADDLRRAYVVLMNFWNQQETLGDAAWGYVKIESAIRGKSAATEVGAWDQHLKLAETAVPADAFHIAATDPLLDELFNLVRHSDNNLNEDEKESQDARLKRIAIRDVTRLRAFTEKLDRCVKLLREGVEKIRSRMKALAAAHGVSDKPEEYEPIPNGPFHIYHLDYKKLKTGGFGLPAGALLIRTRIYPYEIAIARVNNRLQILAVYPDFDGD